MIESEEDIKETFNLVGSDLLFNDKTLRGIPGFHTAYLQKFHNDLYETEVQVFSFIVSTREYSDSGITTGDEFVYSDGVYDYTFSLDRPAVHHLIGYSKIYVNLIDKVLV
jgi:hypothetical protein